MSAVTKGKHVVKELLEDFEMPKSNQNIVRVLGTAGSNLHEVLTSHCERFLASLPMKFRKKIWIKRGDYVIIEPIEEGVKVKAEIVRILYPQHVKAIQQSDLWPVQFPISTNAYAWAPVPRQEDEEDSFETIGRAYDSSDETDDDFPDLPANTNREPPVEFDDSEEEEEESSDED